MRTQKEELSGARDYRMGPPSYAITELKGTRRKAEAEKAWRENGDAFGEVTPEVISEVLASSTGVPCHKITEEESSRL